MQSVLEEFRAARWSSRDELAGFVQAAGRLPHTEVIALLGVVRESTSLAQGPIHKNRCSAFGAIAKGSAHPGLFLPMVDALGSADAILRRVLLGLLPLVNDVTHHSELCDLLDHPDPEFRRQVADILAQVGGVGALSRLIESVSQPNFRGRVEAMRAMVERAGHRAVPLVAAVLAHGDARERAYALRHLADPELSNRDPRALTAVRGALADSDRRVATEAFKAFGQLVEEQVFFDELSHLLHTTEVDPAIVRSLGAYDSPRAHELLAHKIRVGPNVVRFAAIDALEDMASNGAVKPLALAIHFPDQGVRARATEALSKLTKVEGVDVALAIISLLRSNMPSVRRIGAHLAQGAKDSEGELAGRMLAYLEDEDWWVRERVLDALIGLMGNALTPHLTETLSNESPLLRRFAMEGLVRLEDPSALSAVLNAAATDDDWWVREQAVLATARIGDVRAVPYVEKLLRERADLRVVGIEALVALHAHDALLGLAELVGDENVEVRRLMISTLASLPTGREAAFYVRSCLSDDDASVAALARTTLEDWEVDLGAETLNSSMGVLDRLLVSAVRANADDILLATGRAPSVKRLGEIVPAARGVLNEDELLAMVTGALSPLQRRDLESGMDVDFSYEIPAFSLRFRVNLFRQLSGLAAVFRHVKADLPDIETLGLPPIVRSFGDFAHGLVLVGGPTGSGKSTTLAALVHHINQTRAHHILTIEDPIEILHGRYESLVNQREVGTHTQSFTSALRATLRQDPDVILVGELRDRETIEFAVNAAETGHLVLATVHTTSADMTVDRMIHAFPSGQQHLVRSMLAESLRAVVCQQLLRRIDDSKKRVLAVEVMVNNDAISNLIRKDKSFQISSIIATKREAGMLLMDEELERLVRRGIVDAAEALAKAVNKQAFANTLVEAGFLEAPERRSAVPSHRPPRPPSDSPGRPSSSNPPRDQPSLRPSSHAAPASAIPPSRNTAIPKRGGG